MNLDLWRKYWDQLDWVQELLYLADLAMQACMLYPWQLLLNTLSGYEEMSLLGVCLLFWIPYLIASFLEVVEIPADRKQALVAGLMIVGALLTVRLHAYGDYPIWDLSWLAVMAERLFDMFTDMPPDLFLIVLAFIGWWRGVVGSRKGHDLLQIQGHFRTGILVLVGFLLATLLGERIDLAGTIFAFFFFGLMSIALARILDSGDINKSALNSRQWVGMLAGSAAGNLALALLASLIFSREGLRAVLRWFRPITSFIDRMIWLLIMFVFYLLEPLIQWLMDLIRSRMTGVGANVSPLGSPLMSPLEGVQTLDLSSTRRICSTIVVVLVIIVGLLLVTRAIRRLAQRQAEGKDLERESLWSGQDFGKDLRNTLDDALARLRALAGRFGEQHRRSAASIRKIYASMVDLATEAGHPRQAAETPYEYRNTLYRAFAGAERAVDAITEAYVQVHYGEIPGTQAEMEQLIEYWEELRRLALDRAERQES